MNESVTPVVEAPPETPTHGLTDEQLAEVAGVPETKGVQILTDKDFGLWHSKTQVFLEILGVGRFPLSPNQARRFADLFRFHANEVDKIQKKEARVDKAEKKSYKRH